VAVSGLVLRYIGLLSRSALVAPPLQLAALRWPGSVASLERWWPPPGVSAACFVAVAHFSGTRFPRVPPSRMCPSSLEAYAAHSQGRHARRCAPIRSPHCACGSPLKEDRLASAGRANGGCPAPILRGPGVRRRRHARRCANPCVSWGFAKAPFYSGRRCSEKKATVRCQESSAASAW
jgi:hypothetical protein